MKLYNPRISLSSLTIYLQFSSMSTLLSSKDYGRNSREENGDVGVPSNKGPLFIFMQGGFIYVGMFGFCAAS